MKSQQTQRCGMIVEDHDLSNCFATGVTFLESTAKIFFRPRVVGFRNILFVRNVIISFLSV
jgi:hypothetical protein